MLPGNMRANSAKQSAPNMQTSPVTAHTTRATPGIKFMNKFHNINNNLSTILVFLKVSILVAELKE